MSDKECKMPYGLPIIDEIQKEKSENWEKITDTTELLKFLRCLDNVRGLVQLIKMEGNSLYVEPTMREYSVRDRNDKRIINFTIHKGKDRITVVMH